MINRSNIIANAVGYLEQIKKSDIFNMVIQNGCLDRQWVGCGVGGCGEVAPVTRLHLSLGPGGRD